MYPLFFRPILKRIVWGGRGLGDLLGKPLGDAKDYAESWEIVDHRDGQSVVENGPLAGQTLQHLVRKHNADLLGRHAGLSAFPLLLKYLDCNRVLSVQVHPNDAYAMRMPQPDLGKTEAWYIVDARPGSLIYAGLKCGVDRRALHEAILSGHADQVLHALEPQPGQCIFIPAGTVHALGGGLIVAEIQQSSNTTFRLFDWNRIGDDGQSRELHIDQALTVTDYDCGPVAVQVPTAGEDGIERLVDCDKFVLRRACLGGSGRQCELTIGGDDTMYLLSVVQGAAELCAAAASPLAAGLGRSVLIPASAGAVRLRAAQADTTVLLAHLP